MRITLYYPAIKPSLLLCILIAVFSKMSFSQIGKSSVIAPTPIAASLGTVADVPVSLYTGTPSVDFPLYNLACGTLNVGVSLSYNAKGVRVEEVSTGVGVGWTLNAGGVITRTIRGGSAESPSAPELSLPIPASPTLTDFNNLVDWCSQGKGERDIFYYNFNGYSGSFYIKNGQAVLKKYDDLKIEITEGPLGIHFVIVAQDGTIYDFGSGSTTTATEWYLQKIKNYNKTDSVMFQYINAGIYIAPPRNSSYYWFGAYSSVPHLIFSTPAENYSWQNVGITVSKIVTSKSDSIVFKYKPLVYDEVVAGDQISLDTMLVFNSSGERVNKVKFNVRNIKTIMPYDTVYPGYPLVSTSTIMNYRAYLDGFSQVGSDGTLISHSFEYYGRTPDGRDSLPNTLSYAQDMGGFYNGKDENFGLLPTVNSILNPFLGNMPVNLCVDERFPYENVYIAGSDRSPDFAYMKMGTLKAVTYPTGGKVKFTFEEQINPETSEPFYGFNVTKIEYEDVFGTVTKTKKYNYDNATLGHNIPPFYSYTFNFPGSNSLSVSPFCECVNGACDSYRSWKLAIEVSPGPKIDLGLYEGPMIGYGTVEEYEDGNGKTVYTYSNESGTEEVLSHEIRRAMQSYGVPSGGGIPIPLGTYTYGNIFIGDFWPLGPFPNNSWKRGTLLSSKTYKESGQLVQSTDYNFSFVEIDTLHSVKILSLFQDYDYLYYPYSVTTSWIRLDSVSELHDGITKTTRYSYTGTAHRQKTSESYTTSEGIDRMVTYKYPMEMQSLITPNIYNEMTDKHVFQPVIEKSEYTDNGSTLLRTEKNNYDYWASGNWGGTPGSSLIFPRSTEMKKGSAASEIIVRNHAFDNKGNILSIGAENDIRKSYLWGHNNTYPVAAVTNASENEIFFDGFEDGVNWSGISADQTKFHTGKTSGKVYAPTASEVTSHSNVTLAISLTQPTKFRYSGWVYSDGPSTEIILFMKRAGEPGYYSYIDGLSTSETGKWVYLIKEYTVPADVTQLNIRVDNNGNGSAWFDDIRLYPAVGQMISYTYKPLVGITSQSDENSWPVYYEYDQFNRLLRIRDKNNYILKQYEYQYQAPMQYYNVAKSAAITKVCGLDSIGSLVTYTIPAGTYLSQNSQAEADAKAQDSADAGVQAYANLHGTCTANTVYARIAVEGQYSSFGAEYGDIVVRFYSDAAGTIPVSVSTLTVYYNELYTYGLSGGVTPLSTSCSGTNTVLYSNKRIYAEVNDPTYGTVIETFAYALTSGTGYTIIY